MTRCWRSRPTSTCGGCSASRSRAIARCRARSTTDRHASLHVYETAERGWYCFGALPARRHDLRPRRTAVRLRRPRRGLPAPARRAAPPLRTRGRVTTARLARLRLRAHRHPRRHDDREWRRGGRPNGSRRAGARAARRCAAGVSCGRIGVPVRSCQRSIARVTAGADSGARGYLEGPAGSPTHRRATERRCPRSASSRRRSRWDGRAIRGHAARASRAGPGRWRSVRSGASRRRPLCCRLIAGRLGAEHRLQTARANRTSRQIAIAPRARAGATMAEAVEDAASRGAAEDAQRAFDDLVAIVRCARRAARRPRRAPYCEERDGQSADNRSTAPGSARELVLAMRERNAPRRAEVERASLAAPDRRAAARGRPIAIRRARGCGRTGMAGGDRSCPPA